MSIETEITRIKTNIANAYNKCEAKGATLPTVQNSENLSSAIESIEQGSGDWQPQEDWFDIETILENDTEDYPAKMIILLSDKNDSLTLNIISMNKIAKIKTSDGAEYTASSIHTWDKTKDKECSLHYKTRYIMIYFNDTNANFGYDIFGWSSTLSALYIIMKNIELTASTHGTGNWLSGQNLLEIIKFNNSTLIACDRTFANNKSLVNIDLSHITIKGGATTFTNCYNITKMNIISMEKNERVSMNSMFLSAYNLEAVRGLNTSNVTSFRDCFRGCGKLYYIDNLDFSNATDINFIFADCINLRVIEIVSNIKISGISLSPCAKLNHDTLLRFLNALHDYSDDTSGTVHTITFGATNLAKLTAEEIAVGTNKGWTIS